MQDKTWTYKKKTYKNIVQSRPLQGHCHSIIETNELILIYAHTIYKYNTLLTYRLRSQGPQAYIILAHLNIIHIIYGTNSRPLISTQTSPMVQSSSQTEMFFLPTFGWRYLWTYFKVSTHTV